VRYQEQLNRLVPGTQGQARLAHLLSKAGETERATDLWGKLAAGRQGGIELFQALDQLLLVGNYKSALVITGRVLRGQPDNWDLLYREGVALAGLGKPAEAAHRFQAILDLRLPADRLSLLQGGAKGTRGKSSPKGGGPLEFPLLDRLESFRLAVEAAGLDTRPGPPSFFSPADFGQARLAATAWLVRLSRRDGKDRQALVERFRRERQKVPADPQVLWDWVHLQMILDKGELAYATVQELARGPDLAARWLFLRGPDCLVRLASLPKGMPGKDGPEKRPSPPDLEQLLACSRSLRQQRPDWLTDAAQDRGTLRLILELRRAGRGPEEEKIARELLAEAEDPSSIRRALEIAALRDDVAGVVLLCDRVRKFPPGPSALTAAGVAEEVLFAMTRRARAKAKGDLLRLLDSGLAALRHLEPFSPGTPPRPVAGPVQGGDALRCTRSPKGAGNRAPLVPPRGAVR
jgi:tetratricopeptide (TPR) repeat protein